MTFTATDALQLCILHEKKEGTKYLGKEAMVILQYIL